MANPDIKEKNGYKLITLAIVLLLIVCCALTGEICYDYGYGKGIVKGVIISIDGKYSKLNMEQIVRITKEQEKIQDQ